MSQYLLGPYVGQVATINGAIAPMQLGAIETFGLISYVFTTRTYRLQAGPIIEHCL